MASARDIKVGAFVLLGLFLVSLVVFLVGDERQLFAKKVPFRTVFQDVEGLKRGSTVRMGGIDIGTVESVGFSSDAKDSRLYVTFRVVESQARRIRRDSRVRIEAKGLLGDKMIDITPGSPTESIVPSGGVVKSERDPEDLQNALGKVGSIATKAERVMDNLESTTSQLASEELHRDVRTSAESLNHVLTSLDRGPGYLSRLLNDDKEAARLSQTVANLEHASSELRQTLATASDLVERIESGPGLLHEIFYGEDSARAAAQIGDAAEQTSLLLREVREGNGLARSLLVGDDTNQHISGQVQQILADVHGILSDIRAGKGTLGALLVDPSVYEDLKVLLGNVERNKALKSLVRYSIQQSEPERTVEVKDPKGPDR